MATKRFQIGIRQLFIAILLTAIATSFVALNIERSRLDDRAQTLGVFAAQTQSADWKFQVLRGLSVESDHQRDAIQTLLTHWDNLEFRNVGLWPVVDERKKLNTMLFTDAYPDGATVTVLVLMDWDKNKAVDAVSFVSDPETERHSTFQNIDDNGQYELELRTCAPNSNQIVTKRLNWTLRTNGFTQHQTIDRTKR
jgi:hypothetical protein